MAYQVLQGNLPADCFGFPTLDKSWNQSIFNTFEEACEYAYYWAYPLDRETARIMAKNDPFILNEFKDCGMRKENPINMRIVQVNY